MSPLVSWLSLLLVGSLAPPGSQGYEKGAPAKVCDDMTPVHYGAETKDARKSSPFTITANQHVYAENESPYITVTIANKPNAPMQFKGFMLQARNENGTRIGTWSVNPRHKLQLLACNEIEETAVTHTEKISKDGTGKVEAIWIAPDDNQGNITFMATVVQHKLLIHKWLESQPVVWRDSGARGLTPTGGVLFLCLVWGASLAAWLK